MDDVLKVPEKVRPVDEILPLPQLFLFGLQHVLVMAASPITAAFLVSRALNFTWEPSFNPNISGISFFNVRMPVPMPFATIPLGSRAFSGKPGVLRDGSTRKISWPPASPLRTLIGRRSP